MNKLNHPDRLIVTHLLNSCRFFRKTYITQSRATQQANILKAFGEWIPISTFDKSIRRLKDRWQMWKQHRTGKVTGGGHRWTSALTVISFELVMKAWKAGLLTYEQFKELKVILGLVQKRGPAKLQAPPAAQDIKAGKSRHRAFLFPT